MMPELNEQEGEELVGLGMVVSMEEEFAVRQVCQKYLANGKVIFWAFMD